MLSSIKNAGTLSTFGFVKYYSIHIAFSVNVLLIGKRLRRYIYLYIVIVR